MQITLPFGHDYDVEPITELPGDLANTRIHYFPGRGESGGHDGALVKIVPLAAPPWIGCFAFGSGAPSDVTRVIGCPNRSEVCVIASGAGYIVRADDPKQWQPVRCIPVRNAIAIPEQELIVFADFTSLVAYGPDGPKWESARLSSDGLEDISVHDDRLLLTGWDAATQRHKRIAVTIADGSVAE